MAGGGGQGWAVVPPKLTPQRPASSAKAASKKPAGAGAALSFDMDDEGEAFKGAVALLSDPSVIGIVGTGYSSAAPGPAMYCSSARIPLVSPSSTSAELADKARFPYFLRTNGVGAALLCREAFLESNT